MTFTMRANGGHYSHLLGKLASLGLYLLAEALALPEDGAALLPHLPHALLHSSLPLLQHPCTQAQPQEALPQYSTL